MHIKKALWKHIQSETSRKIKHGNNLNEHYGNDMICCCQPKKRGKQNEEKNSKHVQFKIQNFIMKTKVKEQPY